MIPEIKQRLGMDRFNQAIWQQDGAKPHQAHIVMDWLDQVFGDRMLALKARQGMFWAPASPDKNPCEVLKESTLGGRKTYYEIVHL